jgi:hypothetical protein
MQIIVPVSVILAELYPQINWAQVSTELGITNGHAARMRYSRFKQQMEGNPPVRRARNPTAKRAPKQKRPKEESKDLKVKTEGVSSLNDSMAMERPSLSPSLSLSGGNQDSHASMTPEAVSIPIMVKSEPGEDSISSSSGLPSSMTRPEFTHSHSHSRMPSGMSSPSLSEQQQQQQQQQQQLPSQPEQQVQTMADFHFNLPQQQQQQQQQIHHHQSQRMFQTMGTHVHDLMDQQNLSHADMSVLIDTHDHDHDHEHDLETLPFMMEMYHHPMGVNVSDMEVGVGVGVGVGCHGHVNIMGQGPMGPMGPMVKVEERWDASYGR